MKALVAGGTGFIGSHIVRDLISKGIHVRVLIRANSDITHLDNKGIEFIHGSILDVDSLKECTRDVDLVFSAFGILGQWGIPEKKYRDINALGVKNLIMSCLHSNIRRFIHISSAGVLGPLPDGVVADEAFPYNPSNSYERTKCEAEMEIIECGDKAGIPYTIIRPEFVYGPGDVHVLGLFRAIKGRKFVLLGSGEKLLHPTYIDDLMQGINLCSDNEGAAGKIFLITGERPITVKELTNTIADELDVSLPNIKIPLFIADITANVMELGARVLHYEPVLTRSRVKFFTENRAFSYRKAGTELGFVPKVDFREGVRRTVRWYRDNGYL